MAKAKADGGGDGGGAKKVFVDHGEKIGLGVVGIIFLLSVVFGFIGKKTAEATPESIEDILKNKMSQMTGIELPAATIQSAPPGPPPQIPPTPYQLTATWIAPLFPLQGVRAEPKFFPAEQLHVAGGRAPFNTKPTGAPPEGASTAAPSENEAVEGSGAKGEHYAVVTALIPIGKQSAEYNRVFRDTLKIPGDEKLAQDSPEYFRFVIERAEVTPGVADAMLEYHAVNEADNAKITEEDRAPLLTAKKGEWAETLLDVVPLPFTEPALVYGSVPKEEFVPWLPPRLPKKKDQWSMDEVGHPEIAAAMAKMNNAGAAKPADAAAPAAEADADPEAAVKKFVAGYEYRMLRYWDFTVEPGKRYKYRVTLVLKNPNRGYTKQFLKDEKLATGDYRPVNPADAADTTRPVSEPSAVVAIPGHSDLAVGGIVPSGTTGNRTGEDGAKVAASVWENTAEAIALFDKEAKLIRLKRDREKALEEAATLQKVWAPVDYVEASKEFTVYRGSWLNMHAPTTVLHPVYGKIETLKTVRFDTNFLLVDIMGGKPMGDKPTRPTRSAPTFTEPAEYLLLDPEGNLVVRSEIADRPAFNAKLAAEAEAGAGEPAKTGTGDPLSQLNK